MFSSIVAAKAAGRPDFAGADPSGAMAMTCPLIVGFRGRKDDSRPRLYSMKRRRTPVKRRRGGQYLLNKIGICGRIPESSRSHPVQTGLAMALPDDMRAEL